MEVARLLDARYRETDPVADPQPAVIVEARDAFRAGTATFGRIGDAALETAWRWQPESETDVRSAFYLAIQMLQGAAGQVAAALAASGEPVIGPAGGSLAAATRARWDLQALLATLTEGDLDADPGGGEWTIRQTLAHTLHVQRAYPWFSAWWLARRDQPGFPAQADPAHDEGLPPEEADGGGTLGVLSARLDALVTLGTDLWREATADELAVQARWTGFAVDLGFRLGRWAPHLVEHTLQIDKTLVALGRHPSEVDRLVCLLYRAYGELEGTTWGITGDALDVPFAGDTVGGLVTGATIKVADMARSAAAAAG